MTQLSGAIVQFKQAMSDYTVSFSCFGFSCWCAEHLRLYPLISLIRLFICVMSLEIQSSRWEGWNPAIDWFNPTTLVCLSRTWMFNVTCRGRLFYGEFSLDERWQITRSHRYICLYYLKHMQTKSRFLVANISSVNSWKRDIYWNFNNFCWWSLFIYNLQTRQSIINKT